MATTTRTFRFASGQLLTLDSDQIEKIPYLAAIVSSADSFESICDEDGHFKLNPRIDFKHFSFAVESLSFHSVRQIFTHVPKQDDIIPIIALLDFLGIGSQHDPTLEEVGSTFFSYLIYNPLSHTYSQEIRPSILQDMAVRFAVSMIKEEYDFTNAQVIDQIYWYIMFILSVQTFFGPRLRHHIYKIAEHCFSLFCPFLLRSLKRLIWRTSHNTRKETLNTNDEDVGPDKENKGLWENPLDAWPFSRLSKFRHSTVYSDWSFLNHTALYNLYQSKYPSNEEKLFDTMHKRIAETMYKRLQSEICRHAKTEMQKRQPKSVQKRNYEWILSSILEHHIVQEEICKCIVNEICEFIPKLEDMHRELVEEIRKYEQRPYAWFRYELSSFSIYPFENNTSIIEYIQTTGLFYELMLDKLRQYSPIIVEKIRQGVVTALYEVALEKIIEWEHKEEEIVQLRKILSFWRSPEKIFQSISTQIHQKHWIVANKSLSKIQPKYSTR